MQTLECIEKKSTEKFNVGVKTCAENVEKCKERSNMTSNKGSMPPKGRPKKAKLPTCKMTRSG